MRMAPTLLPQIKVNWLGCYLTLEKGSWASEFDSCSAIKLRKKVNTLDLSEPGLLRCSMCIVTLSWGDVEWMAWCIPDVTIKTVPLFIPKGAASAICVTKNWNS